MQSSTTADLSAQLPRMEPGIAGGQPGHQLVGPGRLGGRPHHRELRLAVMRASSTDNKKGTDRVHTGWIRRRWSNKSLIY
jgi:hypothetical protein